MERECRIFIGEPTGDFAEALEAVANAERSINVRVIGASTDGGEAYARILEEKPDVAILDFVLPGIDGFALLKRLRTAMGGSCPDIIMVSGVYSERLASEAVEIGAAYYMQKPCDLVELLVRAEKLAGEKNKPTADDAEHSIEESITEVLHKIGVPAHVKGYYYMREAIVISVKNGGNVNAVTKVIYPDVAKKFNTTPSRVERAIRNAIEIAWDRGDSEAFTKFCGYSPATGHTRPTNSEFISMISDKLAITRKDRK